MRDASSTRCILVGILRIITICLVRLAADADDGNGAAALCDAAALDANDSPPNSCGFANRIGNTLRRFW